jgi:hypothetical protein
MRSIEKPMDINSIEENMKKDQHSPFNIDERKLDDLLRKLYEQNKNKKSVKVKTRTLLRQKRS